MKTGTLEAVSNAETWQDFIELFDDGDGNTFDVSDITEVTLKLRDPASKSTVLEGSYTGGELVRVGDAADGVYRFTFSADTMSALDPKTYEVGVLASTALITKQLILGSLPVLEGL